MWKVIVIFFFLVSLEIRMGKYIYIMVSIIYLRWVEGYIIKGFWYEYVWFDRGIRSKLGN